MKKKTGFLKDKYHPLPYAQTYLYGEKWLDNGLVELRAKIVADPLSSDGIWVNFYVKSRKVWDCNYEFFKSHFVEVAHTKKAAKPIRKPKTPKGLMFEGSLCDNGIPGCSCNQSASVGQ